LDDLSEWFSIPESVDRYVTEVEHVPMFALVNSDGKVVAFLAIKKHLLASAEAYVLGARKSFHRQRLGRGMFYHVEEGQLSDSENARPDAPERKL
jgi:hypothetical protein